MAMLLLPIREVDAILVCDLLAALLGVDMIFMMVLVFQFVYTCPYATVLAENWTDSLVIVIVPGSQTAKMQTTNMI